MPGLEGTIKEFGVADILQLICQQQKTGALMVESRGANVEIYLEEGNISAAHATTGSRRDNLGTLLVKAKLIAPGQLQAALVMQKQTGEQLGEILIQQGAITREDLKRAIQIQIYGTFYDIFQWKEGSYQFNPKEVKVKSPLYQLINIQSILLDVLRMIDEWPDVQRFVPSFEMTFQPMPGIFPADLADDGLNVYNLLDGRRNTQEIIDESLLGKFNTCKILSELLRAGYITEAAPPAAAPARALIAMITQKFSAAIHYAALVLVLFMVMLLPTSFPKNILLRNPKLVKQSYLAEYQKNQALLQIEHALDVYKIRNGRYPASLNELVTAKFLLAPEHAENISYIPEEDSYRLSITTAGTAQ
jgi:hypothetical protein